MMMVLLLSILQSLLAQKYTCVADFPYPLLFVTKGETVKFSLQKIFQGRSLEFILQKAPSFVTLENKKEIMDSQTFEVKQLLDWKVRVDQQTKKWYTQAGMLTKTGRYYYYQIADLQSVDSAIYPQSAIYLVHSKSIKCMTFQFFNETSVVVDCIDSPQNFFFLVDLYFKITFKLLLPSDIVDESQPRSIFTFNSKYVIRAYFHLNYLDVFEIKSKKEMAYITRINKTTLGLEYGNITDFQVYGDYFYLLEKNKGIYQLKLEDNNVTVHYFWKLFMPFSKFNIYKDYQGKILVVVSEGSNLFKLSLTNVVTIIEKFNIQDSTEIFSTQLNQEFMICLALQKSKRYMWVFRSDDRLLQNVFLEYDYTAELPTQIQFNPETNNIMMVQFDSQSSNMILRNPHLIISPKEDQQTEQNFRINAVAGNNVISYGYCKIESGVGVKQLNDADILLYRQPSYELNTINPGQEQIDLSQFMYGSNLEYDFDSDTVNCKLKQKKHFELNIPPVNASRVLFRLQSEQRKNGFILYEQLTTNEFYVHLCSIVKDALTCSQRLLYQLSSRITKLGYNNQTLTQDNTTYFAYALEDDPRTVLVYTNKYISVELSYMIEVDYDIQDISFYFDYLMVTSYYTIYVNQSISHISKFYNSKGIEVEYIPIDQLQKYANCNFIYSFKSDGCIISVVTDLSIILLNPGFYNLGDITFYDSIPLETPIIDLTIYCSRMALIYQDKILIYSISDLNHIQFNKVLNLYDYTLSNPVIYAQAQYLHLLTNTNTLLTYDLYQFQFACLYTTYPYFPHDFIQAININYMDFVIYINSTTSQISALQHFRFPSLQIKTPSESQVLNIIVNNLYKSIQYPLKIKINVQNTVGLQNLSVNASNINQFADQLQYKQLKKSLLQIDDQYIINGSALSWQMNCSQCPSKLELVNHIQFQEQIARIKGCKYISTSTSYLFIQQENNLIALDVNSNSIRYIVPFPTAKTSECLSFSAYKSLYVVSVCNEDQKSEFYLTSFASTQPFTIGPYESQIYIHNSSDIQIQWELLFVLDHDNSLIYIFSLDFAPLDTIDLKDFGQYYSKITSFDVIMINSTMYKLALLTSQSQIELINLNFDSFNQLIVINQYDLINPQSILPDKFLPDNINSIQIMITSYVDLNLSVVVLNENYHSFEFEIIFTLDLLAIDEIHYLRKFIQYGYYKSQKSLKFNEDYLGISYIAPDYEIGNTQVLIIYDKKSSNGILGGYGFQSISPIMFDFKRSTKNIEFPTGIIIIAESKIYALTVSQDLAIKIKEVDFLDQKLYFKVSNDFADPLEFHVSIENHTGEVNTTVIKLRFLVTCQFLNSSFNRHCGSGVFRFNNIHCQIK